MAATEEKAAKYRQFFQQTTFYFDSAEGKLLGAFIEKFGGTLAPFFSNKVKCVVTSLSPNAISHLKSQVKQSPAPNTPYQHNHSPAASWDIASQKTDNREALILKALEMNVRVVTLEQIRTAMSKYFGIHIPVISAIGSKKRSATTRDLTTVALEETIHGGSAEYHVFKNPYLLIEDIHELYRPVYKEYDLTAVREQADAKPTAAEAATTAPPPNTVPYLFLGSLPGHCPFYNPPQDPKKPPKVIDVQTRIKYLQNKKQEAIDYLNSKARDDPFVSFKDKPLQQSKKQKGHNEKKPGFCECCWAKYSDLDRHVLHDQHKAFADNDANYIDLDNLLQQTRRRRKAVEDMADDEPPSFKLYDIQNGLYVNENHLDRLMANSQAETSEAEPDGEMAQSDDDNEDYGSEHNDDNDACCRSNDNNIDNNNDDIKVDGDDINNNNDCENDADNDDERSAIFCREVEVEQLIEAYNEEPDVDQPVENTADDRLIAVDVLAAPDQVTGNNDAVVDVEKYLEADAINIAGESSEVESLKSGGIAVEDPQVKDLYLKNEDDRVLKFTHAPPNPFDDAAVTTQKKQTSPIKYFDMVPVTRSRAHSLKSQIEVNKNMSPRPCDLPPPETLSAPEESCSDRQTSERKCRSKPLQQSVKESANRHHRRSRKSRRLQIAAPDTTVENASPNLLIKLQGAYLLPNNPPSSVPSYKFRKRSALENTCNLDPELERELMVSPQRLNGFCRSSDGDSFHGSDGM